MSTERFAIDGSYVHTVEGAPVKDIPEADLHRYAQVFAARTQALIDAHRHALSQLVANEQALALVTHELASRRRVVLSS